MPLSSGPAPFPPSTMMASARAGAFTSGNTNRRSVAATKKATTTTMITVTMRARLVRSRTTGDIVAGDPGVASRKL
jgi:hypothetical protein